MDPTALIPTPDAIPVAWGWLEGLNVLTFSLHIMLVNILLGGGIFALYLRMHDKHDASAQAISCKLPVLFALTANLGVPPLLFVQVLYGHMFYTSAILSALWWLAIVDLLILGYYAFYLHQYNQKSQVQHGSGFLIAGVGATLFISLVFTAVLTVMIRPDIWTAYFDNPHGTILNFSDPTFLPRYLHFILATLAMGGLLAALLGKYGKGSERGVDMGMRWFVRATALQMLTGVWWLQALDREMMLQFVGSSITAQVLFLVAFALFIPTLAAGVAQKPLAATIWTGLTILAMCGVREVIRVARLEPYFAPGDTAVTGEYSPMILFLVCLVIGLAVIVHMLRLAFRTQEEG